MRVTTLTHLTPDERETVIVTSDADESVSVWTAQRKHITRLRKDPAFTEIRSGHHGSTEWAEFRVKAADWSPAGVKRRRSVTPEQKEAAAARLAGRRATAAENPHNVSGSQEQQGQVDQGDPDAPPN